MALLALVLAAGCGKSPKAVFADLQDAAVKKDAKAIWVGLTPETKLALIAHSKDVFKGPGGTVRAAPTEAQGREYLAMLTANLESLSIEYIKTLRAGTITVKGDTAEIIPTSFRFGSPGKTVKLVKVGGKWLWDAREILEWYLENRSEISNLSQGGF